MKTKSMIIEEQRQKSKIINKEQKSKRETEHWRKRAKK